MITTKKKESPELNFTDYVTLTSRPGSVIWFKRARLELRWISSADYGSKERRFVMQGPSGVHSLLFEATDQNRLNAHWTNFATDPRNDWPRNQKGTA